MTVLQQLQEKLRQALTGLVEDVDDFASLLRPSQDARFGDYQANCAMPLAKRLGKNPREVAQQIAARLDRGDMLEEPQVAGPGFINLRLRPDWLARQVQVMGGDERLGIAPAARPRTLVIDFSSPNVAKPMHVGHLRSTIIGDALARLYRFLGHKVISDNHLGDWGTQFGILLYGYKHFLDREAFAADPVRELARLYVHLRKQVRKVTNEKGDEEEDPNDPIMQAAREETAKLHAGDEENVRLWRTFMPHCQEEIDGVYSRLDIHFDHTLGESFYNPMLPEVVYSLQERGIAQDSKGAVVIFFGENEPPALVRKSDGAFTYTTTDLATIRYRMEQWQPDAILYVVDFRQTFHFKGLFEAAGRWGYDKVELQHISFGSVLGSNGKPFSTSEGTGASLELLLNEAVAHATRVLEQKRQEELAQGRKVVELSEAEKRVVAEAVGVGAVKYADLSQNRTSDYKFDPAKMTSTEGNTATYMQYAYVRNRGIFRKGEVDEAALRQAPPLPILETPEERVLALQLARLGEALENAAAEYQPHQITGYLWDLAKAYSSFFTNCPVLQAETPLLRQSRLLLCDLTARVIERCLDLLGIRIVERM
jgi:arginyl-tRNA synthetase